MSIPFNRPPITGREIERMEDCIARGKTSGNGYYTAYCQQWLAEKLDVQAALLTTSGSAALDMSALLCGIQPGDEVIIPAFTFTSTANAFALRGAKIVFADVLPTAPVVDADAIASLITPRTKVIVVVHYAGIAPDMDAIGALARDNNIVVIEDAAMSFGAKYRGRYLGSFGRMGILSFHETKVLACGEGGALLLRDAADTAAAEIIWEKGTNRAAFARGETQKYEWVGLGSSFLLSDIQAAWLSAQLDHHQAILKERMDLWNTYHNTLHNLAEKGHFLLPQILPFCDHNASVFYLKCKSGEERNALLAYLQDKGILAVFHYQPLHTSPYFSPQHDGRQLVHAEDWSRTILRLPLYYGLSREEVIFICDSILAFF